MSIIKHKNRYFNLSNLQVIDIDMELVTLIEPNFMEYSIKLWSDPFRDEFYRIIIKDYEISRYQTDEDIAKYKKEFEKFLDNVLTSSPKTINDIFLFLKSPFIFIEFSQRVC